METLYIGHWMNGAPLILNEVINDVVQNALSTCQQGHGGVDA